MDVYYSKFEPKQTNNKTHNLKIGNKVNMGLQDLGLTYLLVPSLFFFWNWDFWLLSQILISMVFSLLLLLAQRETATPNYFWSPNPCFLFPQIKKKKSNLLLDDGMGTFKDEEKRQRKWGKEQRRRRDGLTQCPGHQPSCVLQEESVYQGVTLGPLRVQCPCHSHVYGGLQSLPPLFSWPIAQHITGTWAPLNSVI